VKLYDVRAVAEILAISPWTVRCYIRKGKLRPVRIGRLVRLDEQELERFVARAKVKSNATQIETEETEESCSTT
jgi:excisionase family DNA binding protein